MPAHPVDPATQERIREACARLGSKAAAARELGLDRMTIRKYAGGAKVAPPPRDPVKTAEERRAAARELAREREQLEAVAGERSFRAYLDGLLREAVPVIDAPPRFREKKPGREAVDESLILLLSDWHAYEVVRKERVLDLNEYNAEVLGRRAFRVIQSVRSIADKLRCGGWRFPRLVVAANGDMISGTIHEVERHSDAPNVIQAAIGCGLLLAQCVRDLAASFEVVEVFGTSGNHGRLPDHRRVSQKDPSRSWDYLIYAIARQALADCANVKFTLPDSYSAVYEVEGWRFYQGHGHDIKSWQSIPFYGISRAATGLNALRVAAGVPIHYFLFSHFHNPGSICAPGSEYFVNGSLIGGTEFSVNGLGRSDKPCQWLLGVHRDHGVTHRWPIQADGPGAVGSYDVAPWAKG
jgi:ribosomal protein S14